jgi:hypothetical protein
MVKYQTPGEPMYGRLDIQDSCSGFLDSAPRICPHLISLATKDYSEDSLACSTPQSPCIEGHQDVLGTP